MSETKALHVALGMLFGFGGNSLDTKKYVNDAAAELAKLENDLDDARKIIQYADECNKTPKVHRGDNGITRAWSLESQQQIAIDKWLSAHPKDGEK